MRFFEGLFEPWIGFIKWLDSASYAMGLGLGLLTLTLTFVALIIALLSLFWGGKK